MTTRTRRKCRHCGQLFRPDPRNLRHQRYCSAKECRRASKAASQRRWLAKAENRDYFRGPEQMARVRAWRAAHIMVDNLKSAVLQRSIGQAPVFNPRYADFARHHRFEIAPCNVRAGHEKVLAGCGHQNTPA